MSDVKRRALARVRSQSLLSEISALEPERLDSLIDLALAQPLDTHRRRAYEALKRLGSQFVGWYAQRPEIKTEAHYDAMIAFIGMKTRLGCLRSHLLQRGHQFPILSGR